MILFFPTLDGFSPCCQGRWVPTVPNAPSLSLATLGEKALLSSRHLYSKPRQLRTCPSQVSSSYHLAKGWDILIGQDLGPPLPEGLGQSVREGTVMTFIPAHFPRGMAGVGDRKKAMLLGGQTLCEGFLAFLTSHSWWLCVAVSLPACPSVLLQSSCFSRRGVFVLRAVMEELGHLVLALHKALRAAVSDGLLYLGELCLTVTVCWGKSHTGSGHPFASCHSKGQVSRTSPPLNLTRG